MPLLGGSKRSETSSSAAVAPPTSSASTDEISVLASSIRAIARDRLDKDKRPADDAVLYFARAAAAPADPTAERLADDLRRMHKWLAQEEAIQKAANACLAMSDHIRSLSPGLRLADLDILQRSSGSLLRHGDLRHVVMLELRESTRWSSFGPFLELVSRCARMSEDANSAMPAILEVQDRLHVPSRPRRGPLDKLTAALATSGTDHTDGRTAREPAAPAHELRAQTLAEAIRRQAPAASGTGHADPSSRVAPLADPANAAHAAAVVLSYDAVCGANRRVVETLRNVVQAFEAVPVPHPGITQLATRIRKTDIEREPAMFAQAMGDFDNKGNAFSSLELITSTSPGQLEEAAGLLQSLAAAKRAAAMNAPPVYEAVAPS